MLTKAFNIFPSSLTTVLVWLFLQTCNTYLTLLLWFGFLANLKWIVGNTLQFGCSCKQGINTWQYFWFLVNIPPKQLMVCKCVSSFCCQKSLSTIGKQPLKSSPGLYLEQKRYDCFFFCFFSRTRMFYLPITSPVVTVLYLPVQIPHLLLRVSVKVHFLSHTGVYIC